MRLLSAAALLLALDSAARQGNLAQVMRREVLAYRLLLHSHRVILRISEIVG